MIYVALGSNMAGNWGPPEAIVIEAIRKMDAAPSCRVLRRSSLYRTVGVGPGQPEPFVNAIVEIDCHFSPRALLSFLKRLERAAGTRSSLPWGPRSLDLDIIDFRGRICGWRPALTPRGAYRENGQIVLPHPLAHLRPFVLQPLTDVAPQWRHPVFHAGAAQLLGRLSRHVPGSILEKLR